MDEGRIKGLRVEIGGDTTKLQTHDSHVISPSIVSAKNRMICRNNNKLGLLKMDIYDECFLRINKASCRARSSAFLYCLINSNSLSESELCSDTLCSSR